MKLLVVGISMFLCGGLALAQSSNATSQSEARSAEPRPSVEAEPRLAADGVMNEPLIVNDTITAASTIQDKPRIVLSGHEFYATGGDTGDGIALLLGVNRLNNRQLWIADPAKLARNSTNTVLRIHIGDQTANISALSTDGATGKHLTLNSAGGNVGIGSLGGQFPTAKLMVSNNVANTQSFLAQQYSIYSANANSSDMAANGLMKTSVQAGVTQAGTALGQSGLSYLEGAGTLQTAFGLLGYVKVTPGHTGTINNAYGVWSDVDKFNGAVSNGYGLYVGDIEATNDYGIFQSGQDDSNQFNGAVTVGTTGATGTKLTVNGNVSVTGSITGASVIGATYQDLAEWVLATSDMEPGTVVVLNHDRTNEVMPSSRAYDTSVAGVVSAQPGIILGVGSDSKEQIATTGRVKVRVDATYGPVRVGDLLVTSDRPGYAMRSMPVDVAGISMHRPGTIVGKALEALAGGEGEILVLLSLQ